MRTAVLQDDSPVVFRIAESVLFWESFGILSGRFCVEIKAQVFVHGTAAYVQGFVNNMCRA